LCSNVFINHHSVSHPQENDLREMKYPLHGPLFREISQ
jgi:hypothetical protein